MGVDFSRYDPAVDGTNNISQAIAMMYNYRSKNENKARYYYGAVVPRTRSSVIPQDLAARYHASLHWARLAVDSIAERLYFRKWIDTSATGFGLQQVYEENNLGSEFDKTILDALIFGVGYATIGVGDTSIGEPEILIRGLSPNLCFGQYDNRARKLVSAISIIPDYKHFDQQIPYTHQEKYYITVYNTFCTTVIRYEYGSMEICSVDYHNLGVCPVVRITNNLRVDYLHGESEISYPMRCYVDMGINTLRAMQINSDFYSMPRYYVLNADIQDELSQARKSALEMVAATIWSINGGDGPLDRAPQVGQLNPADPTPYTQELECLAQQFASEASIPQSYLGFVSDQNISADSIRAAEAKLIKKVERKQRAFTPALIDIARLSLLLRDGCVPSDFNRCVSVSWDDPASQARGAATDQALKLVSANIVPAHSSILLKNIGFSEQEISEIERDRQQQNNNSGDMVNTGFEGTPMRRVDEIQQLINPVSATDMGTGATEHI